MTNKRDNLDLIIHRLKEIQTNVEDVMGWNTVVSWEDVMDWMIKELENRDLRNSIGDIIIDLEEYRKAHSVDGLIKEEQKNRQIALELECKAECYRGKADNYLKILKEIEEKKN